MSYLHEGNVQFVNDEKIYTKPGNVLHLPHQPAI